MRKFTLLLATIGLAAASVGTFTYAASKDELTQKYQSMINKAYNNALSSTKPLIPPDSKTATSTGQAALTPTAPNIPPVAAAPEPLPPTTPSAQPPTVTTAPPPAGGVTNPSAAPAGPPNIFITPGSPSSGGNGSSTNRNSGNNIIHY